MEGGVCRLSKSGGGVADAARLCTCVYLCDLPLLRRLMRAGALVNSGDYDKRTALHISAAEGNLAVVRLALFFVWHVGKGEKGGQTG